MLLKMTRSVVPDKIKSRFGVLCVSVPHDYSNYIKSKPELLFLNILLLETFAALLSLLLGMMIMFDSTWVQHMVHEAGAIHLLGDGEGNDSQIDYIQLWNCDGD